MNIVRHFLKIWILRVANRHLWKFIAKFRFLHLGGKKERIPVGRDKGKKKAVLDHFPHDFVQGGESEIGKFQRRDSFVQKGYALPGGTKFRSADERFDSASWLVFFIVFLFPSERRFADELELGTERFLSEFHKPA